MPRYQSAIYFLIFIAAVDGAGVFAQPSGESRYWVFFKDTGREALEKANESSLYRERCVSPRSLERRRKVLPESGLLLAGDLPVNRDYVEDLRRRGYTPRVLSKWLNAASLYLGEEDVEAVKSLPYVKELRPVAVFVKSLPLPGEEPFSKPVLPAGDIAYGLSAAQVQMVGVPELHDLKVFGSGVLIGMMDSGFNRNHEILKDLDVVAEWDFVKGDGNTANEANDTPGQDKHGSQTLAVLGGYKEEQLIGPAFGASFVLAKTEIISHELRIEEDNWVAAIEWMDSIGVDLVSSSLGYANDFSDRPDYTFSQMDGKTTVTTVAAQAAADRGIVVVNSVGNERQAPWRHLIAPADAPGVLAVGAVDYNGVLADFSSPGPTADGRIKPDCVGPGSGVYTVGFTIGGNIVYNGYSFGSGTSFSAPLVAGGAALILDAHPDMTPGEVLEAVHKTADRATTPNNDYGYGLFNAFEAALYHGPVIGREPAVETAGTEYRLSIYAAGTGGLDEGKVQIHYQFNNGLGTFETVMMQRGARDDQFIGSIPAIALLADSVRYYFTVQDAGGKRVRLPRGDGTFSQPLMVTIPEQFELVNNFPNPFNATTKIVMLLPEEAVLTIKIYNAMGKEIRKLAVQRYSPGKHFLVWDGRNEEGLSVASGVYFCRASSARFAKTIKMLYLK